jgi:hypothetical protein
VNSFKVSINDAHILTPALSALLSPKSPPKINLAPIGGWYTVYLGSGLVRVGLISGLAILFLLAVLLK